MLSQAAEALPLALPLPQGALGKASPSSNLLPCGYPERIIQRIQRGLAALQPPVAITHHLKSDPTRPPVRGMPTSQELFHTHTEWMYEDPSEASLNPDTCAFHPAYTGQGIGAGSLHPPPTATEPSTPKGMHTEEKQEPAIPGKHLARGYWCPLTLCDPKRVPLWASASPSFQRRN